MKKLPPHSACSGFSQVRRQLLGLVAASAGAALAPGGVAAPTRDRPRCIVRPEQTQGPYFLDARLRRSDIRSDPDSGVARPGAPLRLALRVSQRVGQTCRPLQGAVIDLWQCDAAGVYSGVRDFAGRFDTRGQAFLRGYQLTEADGVARFVTIYPGWYPGRAVHIHFKIRTAAGTDAQEFSSQLYFDDALTDRVHAQPTYASHGRRRTRNREDGIFRRGGEHLILPVEREAQGYAAEFAIALLLPAARA